MQYQVNTMSYPSTASSQSEYLLIAMPDKSLIEGLEAFQQSLVQDVYTRAETLPVRYLSLAGLMAKDYLEETLSRWIMKVCRMKPAFTLSFENDLSFKEGVLSLQIADSFELKAFHHQLGVLDDFLSASECLPLQLVSRPQLPVLISHTLATGNKLLAEFKGQFRIKEIAMLKRNKYHDRFERINVFGLR